MIIFVLISRLWVFLISRFSGCLFDSG